MTEAPDVYPDFPDDDGSGEPGEPDGSDDGGIEGAAQEQSAPVGQVRTGDHRVDAVLDALAGLDDRPVTEHAAIFEGAHEQLRAALEPERETA